MNFTRADNWQRGAWIRWKHPLFQQPQSGYKNTAALICPNCGRHFCLANHTIDASGLVSPSVVCPFSCGFHESGIRLDGWP